MPRTLKTGTLRWITAILAILIFPAISAGIPAPFDGNRVDPNGVALSSDMTTTPEIDLPDLPAGVASATSDGRAAWETASALVAKLEGYLAAGQNDKALAASRYIQRVLPEMTRRMNGGDVDADVIRSLEQRRAAVEKELGGMGAARLVETAKGFNGYSTRSGPGGGNVACAWLVSAILRSAGLVPAGWHDNVANDLVARLVREFNWSKVPPGGREYSGSVSTSQMMPGDVIFWSPSEHVGVYLGNGMALSNSSGRARAVIHPASGYYDGWIPRFVVRPPAV